jgi:deazaflavin-dependent oxidoreductase (nitroreductase family)
MARDTVEQARERDERYRRSSAEHIARYIATDGAEGYDDNSNKAPTLLLTTIGRRSGREIVSPLYFAEDDGRYVIIASYAGSDAHPKWYLNLEANPSVTVQIKGDRFPATARTAEGEEQERLWRLMADQYSFYDGYREATDRNIPVVVLERTGQE